MLDNFQLAAIVKQSRDVRLLRIPLHQTLQGDLAGTWQGQFDSFYKGAQHIEFNAGYLPEDHELFCLKKFQLPEWLANESSQSAANLDVLKNVNEASGAIRGMVGFARDEKGDEVMLFQNFNRAHVIQPGNFLLLRAGTYQASANPALVLDGKLSAVYLPKQGKLFFQNFRVANTFLPLADYSREASEQEIREVLGHHRLIAENSSVVAEEASQWARKRFAMLRDSGVLDRYSVTDIKKRATGYNVTINVRKGKIVFPSDKHAVKKLLQFLNEELFRGAITETLYETNSRREAD